jgi:hypothetical protein
MGTVIRIATWPARTILSFAIGKAMDAAFGKEDMTPYVSRTNGD